MAIITGTLAILGTPTMKVGRYNESYVYPEVKIGERSLKKVLINGTSLKRDFEECQGTRDAEYKLTSSPWKWAAIVVALLCCFLIFLIPAAAPGFLLYLGSAFVVCMILRNRYSWRLRWIRRGDSVTRDMSFE